MEFMTVCNGSRASQSAYAKGPHLRPTWAQSKLASANQDSNKAFRTQPAFCEAGRRVDIRLGAKRRVAIRLIRCFQIGSPSFTLCWIACPTTATENSEACGEHPGAHQSSSNADSWARAYLGMQPRSSRLLTHSFESAPDHRDFSLCCLFSIPRSRPGVQRGASCIGASAFRTSWTMPDSVRTPPSPEPQRRLQASRVVMSAPPRSRSGYLQ